jgi:hypothetical protein
MLVVFNVDSYLGQNIDETHNQCHHVGEGHNIPNQPEEQTASHEEDQGDAIDTPMVIDAHVSLACTYCASYLHFLYNTDLSTLEPKRAKNVGALATELIIPQLPNILHRFLHMQHHPTDTHDPEDIPLDECPLHTGKLCVYNSACSTFFALSDLSGVYGMHREYIHSCPMWRSKSSRFDCVFVVTDLQAEGMHALDIACVLCFFSFKCLGKLYPCAVVHWFDHVGDAPSTDTGMWVVRPSYYARNIRNIAVIHIDTIYRAAHLIPVYSSHNVNL